MRSRVVLALVIVAGFTLTVSGQTAPPRTLQKSRPGQRMEVTMKDGEKLRGKLVALEADRISIAPEPRGTPQREIQLTDIRKVQKKWTTQDKWIIAGLVYGGLVLLGVVLGR